MTNEAGLEPLEHLLFQEPSTERSLPSTVAKKVASSFREAEFAVSHNKPVSAASAIRNTIRLLVEAEGQSSDDLKAAIKKLGIDEEYKRALGNLKLVGDHTLHFEEYETSELVDALEVMYLAINKLYVERERLKRLEKAVGDKASKKSIDDRMPI